MSHIVTLELTDEIYSELQQQADKVGLSVTDLITQKLQQPDELSSNISIEIEKEIARKRFESHFGEIQSSDPTSINNEKIDADLAQEYSSNNQEN